METDAEWLLLKAIYADLRLYVNFFQPVLKLVDKDRLGERVIKCYDTATTPYQRILDSPYVSENLKVYLRLQYVRLNPVTLRNRIDAIVAKLWKLAR